MVGHTPSIDSQLERALAATSERTDLDFKRAFDPFSDGEWCEILKDIAAIANSGGGLILVGLDDHGVPTGGDVRGVIAIDPAKFADKIRAYTGENFDGVSVEQVKKGEAIVAVFRVATATTPFVFTCPGTYLDPGDPERKKQKTAFGKGTIYFRHGAKSEPGTTADIRHFVDAEVDAERAHLLRGMRKVVRAPRGSRITVVAAEPKVPAAAAPEFVRPVADPAAPEARLRSPDQDWPHMGKELIARANERLAGRATINAHDLLCVRRAHRIDEEHPEFHYKSRTSAHQYSPALLDWIVEKFEADPDFFRKARDAHRAASGDRESRGNADSTSTLPSRETAIPMETRRE